MDLILKLENDSDFRTFIKDSIKHQVLGIVREELTEIVKKEINQKLENLSSYNVEQLTKSIIKTELARYIPNSVENKDFKTQFLIPILKDELFKKLKKFDIQKIVDKISKDYLKLVIDKE